MRILVADDNPDALESLAQLLEMSGHEVRTASDGGEAVDVASSWSPDVAILDLRMPVLDGHAAAAAIRARIPGIVLAAWSGHLSEWNRTEQAKMLSFDLWFPKGVGFHEILERVHAVSGRRQG